jgi:hypothetical protein
MTSYSGQGIDLPLSASGDLNSYQYRFVALTSNRKVLGATGASNPTPLGVLQNDPRDGEEATVRVGGTSLIYAEAVTAINVGTPLISGSTGMARPAVVSSSAVSAVALEALASGTGILIEALIVPFSAPSAS